MKTLLSGLNLKLLQSAGFRAMQTAVHRLTTLCDCASPAKLGCFFCTLASNNMLSVLLQTSKTNLYVFDADGNMTGALEGKMPQLETLEYTLNITFNAKFYLSSSSSLFGHLSTGLAPGERIYSVRYNGPMGYVVTFRQVLQLAMQLGKWRQEMYRSQSVEWQGQLSQRINVNQSALQFTVGPEVTVLRACADRNHICWHF